MRVTPQKLAMAVLVLALKTNSNQKTPNVLDHLMEVCVMELICVMDKASVSITFYHHLSSAVLQ